jgi:hypothetical protein
MSMPLRAAVVFPSMLFLGVAALLSAGGADVAPSRALAETFAKKVALIVQQGSAPTAGARRTTLTEAEMNSWFAFRGQRVMPTGVSSPEVSLIGGGRVKAQATLDLEEVGRRRGGKGGLDLWSYLGGRVPLTVTGILHASEGRGRFEVQEATAASLPVPTFLLQELVSAYTRSPEDPEGVRLDQTFDLPLNIRQVELAAGQAVVVQ